ncbi:MAG: lipopolysaccharide biosynthesis protein [Acidimicrobiales bacterium]
MSRNRAVSLTFGANVVLAGLNATTGVLAARLLGPAGRGELAAIQLWPSFLATLAVLGLPDALVYFASTDRDRLGRYLGSATALALCAAAVAMAIGYPLMGVLLPTQSDAVVSSARLYLLVCPLFVLVGLPFHALRGAGEFGLWNAIRIAPSVLWLLILGVSAIEGADALVLPRWHLGALTLLMIPVLVLTARRVAGPFRPDRDLSRPLLRYGIPGMLTTVPQQLNLRLDQLLMAALLPTRDLGLYVAAASWSLAVGPLVTAVGAVLFPSVALLTDADERAAVLARGSRLALLLGVGMVGAVSLVTWPGIRLLFGDDFGGAVGPAVVLVAAAGVLSYGFVLQEGLRGLGLPRAVLRSEMVGLGVTAVALAVFLPTLGILGAAIASLLGYLTVAVMLLRRIVNATGMTYSELLRPTTREVDVVIGGAGRAISRALRRQG